MEKFEKLGTYVVGTPGGGEVQVPWRTLLETELIRKLEEKRIAKQFLVEDRSLIGASGDSKTLRIENASYYTITSFADTQTIPAMTSVDKTEVPFTPTYWGGYDTLTGAAQKASDIDMVKEIARRLSNGIARGEDARVWAAILNPTAVVNISCYPNVGDSARTIFKLTSAGTEATWKKKALEVTQVTVNAVEQVLGTDYNVDYYNGLIKFAVAPGVVAVKATFKYTDRTCLDAGTKKACSYSDLVNIQATMNSKYAELSDLILENVANSDLLVDDKYLNALRAGIEKPAKGAVGGVLNANIFSITNIPSKVVMGIMRAGLGRYLIKEDVTAKIEDIPLTAGNKYIEAWVKTTPAILNADQIVILLNCQTYAVALVYT